MDARKSPRKPVLTHTNVVVIDGVEYAAASDTINPVARKRKLVKLDSDYDQLLRKSYQPKRDAFAFPDHSDDGHDFNEDVEHEKEHSVPLSIMKAQGSLQESDGFDGADDDEDVDMVKQDDDEAVLAAEQDDDMLLTQLSAFQTQDTEEGDPLETQEQERKIKPRAASTLPIVFGEKINRTKALLECEGDAVDLSGDMGAVGRFTVDHRDNDILLDLKGIIYKTTIVPSNTFMVVNVGQTEAKVEAIMNDFVQLREDTKFNENETMVEGTLQGFAFDSDEELERPAVEKAGSPGKITDEEGADDEKGIKKKKLPAKAPKSGKTPAKKAVAGKSKVGGKAKVKVGKKPTAKATKTKGKK